MATRIRKNSSPPAGGSPSKGNLREAVGTVLAAFSGPSTAALAQA